MAANSQVEYTIRLKDQMSGALKKMGLSVSSLRSKLSKGLAGGLKVATIALKSFAVAATAAAAAGGVIAAVAIRMGKSFVDAASMAEETRTKFGAVFKELTGDAEEVAGSMADALGRNQTEIMGFMARLQDTFVPMGIARDSAMDMSTSITSLAYDLASFNPEMGSAAEVMDSLTSAMIGSHETVKKFGVIINEATLKEELLSIGAKKVNGVFTEQDKTMARLNLIIKGTSDAHGDLIKTQDSWFNSTEALRSKITGLREEMGERLIGELQNAIEKMGGVDAIVGHVRVAFEFFANVLTQLIIPTIGNLMTNFSKFVEGMGGVDETVKAVAETVALLGKVFGVMWDSVKLIMYYFVAGLETLKFAALASWEIFKMLVGIIGLALVTALEGALRLTGLFYKGLDLLVIFIKDTVIGIFQGLLNTLADLIEGIGNTLSWLGEFGVVPQMIADAGAAAQGAADGLREFSEAGDELKGGQSLFADISTELDGLADKLGPTQAMLRDFVEASYDNLEVIGTDFVDAIMEDVPAIEELYASIKEGAAGVGTDYEALAAKVGEAMEALSEIEIVSPEQQDQVKAFQDHLERLEAPLKTLQDAEAAAAEAGYGLADAFEDMKGGASAWAKEQGTMSDQMQEMTSGALQSFGDGMTNAMMSVLDGSKSAGEAFKEFAASFLMDIARMIIQTLVFKAIRSAMGIPCADGGVVSGGLGDLEAFANGGAIQGGLGRFVPLKGYATGGPIVNKPHVALIGEGQHNEAVVPLPDGRSIPVDLSGAPETQVAINIEAVDGASVDRMLFDRKDTLRSIISTAIAESRSFRGAVARA